MSNTKSKSATKVIIPCRISFANIWQPKSINGSEEKYSVSCLIPKGDKATLMKIHKAVEAAKEDGKTRKWNGKVPPNLKLPLRDGDIERPEDENYAGHMFLNATSKDAPQIVNRRVQPIMDAMLFCVQRDLTLTQNLIHADETAVQVLKEPGKSATSESRMWVYASGEGSARPVRCFEYQPDRSAKRPVSFLKGFKGCLVTDGYVAYEQVPDVVLCGCWAHMKRKWREAMPKGATTENSKAAVGYQYCNKLFKLEKKFAELKPELKKTARQAAAEPLLDAYWLWLETVHPEPGSKLAEAVTYAKNQKEKLTQRLYSQGVFDMI